MKKWTSELSVGNDEIDLQHQRIFSITNDIYNNIINRGDNMATILLRLVLYTREHLVSEETIFLEYIDDGELGDIIKYHISEHLEFVEAVYQKIKEFLDGELVGVDIAISLNHWINDHVIKDDVNLFKMINQRKQDLNNS